MATIRLTKEFSFEAAHALDGYDGPCREIHGHSYRLFVTVKGHPSEDPRDPKTGMIAVMLSRSVWINLDPAQPANRLKTLLAQTGADLIISSCALREQLAARFGNIVCVPYQPTCENMLDDFARRIAARLPEGVRLHALRLHETATSFAEWFAEENGF